MKVKFIFRINYLKTICAMFTSCKYTGYSPTMCNRVSQIAGIFVHCIISYYHAFCQIGPVKRNRTKKGFSRFFLDLKIDIFSPKILLFSCIQGGNISNFKSRKNVKTFIKHYLKLISGKRI